VWSTSGVVRTLAYALRGENINICHFSFIGQDGSALNPMGKGACHFVSIEIQTWLSYTFKISVLIRMLFGGACSSTSCLKQSYGNEVDGMKEE